MRCVSTPEYTNARPNIGTTWVCRVGLLFATFSHEKCNCLIPNCFQDFPLNWEEFNFRIWNSCLLTTSLIVVIAAILFWINSEDLLLRFFFSQLHKPLNLHLFENTINIIFPFTVFFLMHFRNSRVSSQLKFGGACTAKLPVGVEIVCCTLGADCLMKAIVWWTHEA